MAQKRQDIQGIRGWAIALVVTFHFFPAYCPNGYVGVDMFFVVSGFLMAMIITRMEMTASSYLNYYYKRIKRILPLYYMTSAAILLYVVLRLPSFRSINFPSSRKAVLLITNIRLSENDPVMDYEKMLSNADDLFTHTWSLSVEMQWYLLAPLLFFVQNLIPLRRTIFLLGITFTSLGFYLATDSNAAFYNTFARMWQFCFGIIAFVSSENHKNHASQVIKADNNPEKEEHRTNCIFMLDFILWLLFILAILLPFFGQPLPKRFLRIETTIMTATLIVLGKERKVSALTVQEVVFVGEISYALYLIHWPVLIIMEYHYSRNPLNPCVGVIVSFLLAMLVYRFYEKKYLQWSPPIICFLICVLFVCCIYLSSLSRKGVIINWNKVDYNRIKVEDAAWNLTLMRQLNAAEAEGEQHMWHKECNYSGRFSSAEPPRGLCVMKNGDGKINMLVAGNSFACNQGDIIYKAFKRYARQFNIFCISKCEMFHLNCNTSFNFTHVVKELRPEVVFMIDRAITMKVPLNVSASIDEDRVFNLFMKTLKLLEETAKKVYILQALPSCILDCAYVAMDYLVNEKPLNTIKDGLIENDEFFARHRIWEIGRRCKNCEIVDYMPVLVDKKGHYLGYDSATNLMYLDAYNHFNRFGKQRIQTVFNELAKKFAMFKNG